MANPADSGTLDLWIAERIPFRVLPPASVSTGDFDVWITERVTWAEYAEMVGPHDLTGDNLTTGAPTLTSPTLTQTHVLSADSLTAGVPTLTSPALAQVHALTATALTTGAPTLTSPALTSYDPAASATPAARTYTVGAESRIYRITGG